MVRIANLVVIIGWLSLASCSDRLAVVLDSTDDRPEATYLFDWNSRVGEIPSEADRYYPIDSTLHFGFSEWYAPNGRSSDPMFIIHQRTDQEYFAYNFSILLDVETSPGLIRITYRTAYIGNFTLDAFGPASTWSYFSMPDGVYTLQFEKDDLVDRYELSVDNRSYQVRPIQTSFTRNDNETTGRYLRSSFALYWSGDETGMEHFNAIAAIFRENVNFTEIHRSDQPLNPIWQSLPIGDPYEPLLFSYAVDSHWQTARSLLKEYTIHSELYRESTRIVAVSWRNQRFDTNDYH